MISLTQLFNQQAVITLTLVIRTVAIELMLGSVVNGFELERLIDLDRMGSLFGRLVNARSQSIVMVLVSTCIQLISESSVCNSKHIVKRHPRNGAIFLHHNPQADGSSPDLRYRSLD